MGSGMRRQLGASVMVLACVVLVAAGGAAAHGHGGVAAHAPGGTAAHGHGGAAAHAPGGAAAHGHGGATAHGGVPCTGAGGGAAGLAAAIDAANASGGGVISLASGCTYSLTSANNTLPGVGANGLPVITTAITINGDGGATIAGNNSNFRILAISGQTGGSLTLNGITITGGNVSGDGPAGFGGGILDLAGTLTLNHSVVTGNTASGAGGGIASGTMGPGPGATLSLNNSEVSSNTVPPSGMGGGGILNLSGALTIDNSTIDHNTASGGGGIVSGNGTGGGAGSLITINNTVISNNSATGGEETGGGGISNGGTLQMTNTDLTGNDADGGVGGGLLNHAAATLTNVTITGNTAAIGAGIANVNLQGIPSPGATPPVPALTLNSVTVTGNTASVAGGGVAQFSPFGAPFGTIEVQHAQVSGNSPNNCSPVGSVAGCDDTVFVFTAALSGGNENPPVASSGTGNAIVTWDTHTNEMTVNVVFSGLTSGATASHIHCCAVPPANAGVATTVPTFPGFPIGATAGTYSRTFDMTNAGSYNPAFVTANGGTPTSAEAVLFAGLVAGQAYLNIHSTMFPSGEIRGVLLQP